MSASTKNPKSGLYVKAAMSLLMGSGLRAGDVLPCFLADNHAETFGWITRNFDLDERHTLVLIDAHSDASAAERSDEIRERLRRVGSLEERAARVANWRREGRIQAYNWIEPLMPRPVEKVIWCPAPAVTAERLALMRKEAAESLDGRSEVEPRDAGSFATRLSTRELGTGEWDFSGPVILAVDLDFFAGMSVANREETFEFIWRNAMTWPRLRGVAFAVSRPWLGDDAEADALVQMAADVIARTRGATLELDAAAHESPDDSKRAGEFKATGHAVPRWSLHQASPVLCATLGILADRLKITGCSDHQAELMTVGEIRPDAGELDCDGVWRFPHAEAPALRSGMPQGASGRVRWFAWEAAHPAVDLWPETGLGKSFSVKPAHRIYETRRWLGETTDFALAADRWKPIQGGRVRLQAEIETPGGWLPTPPVEIRLSVAEGFRGALSECFGMPYVFGVAGVEEANLTSVETGWGSDCANLLVHAWRRQGIALAWGDPGRLRRQLTTIADAVEVSNNVPISPGQVERGLAIDFGRHVAALWEDLPPLGLLEGNDLVMHHLGGLPEIVELRALAEGRPAFALREPPHARGNVLRVAGDVVLAGDDLREVDGFDKADAVWFLINLEGVPSMAVSNHLKHHDFRFPPERLETLNNAGVDVVSLANNHAGDAGRAGLVEGMRALRRAGIACTGAGANEVEACKPWRDSKRGVEIAIFGVCLVDALKATADEAGVACMPEHSLLLGREMGEALARGEKIVVMVHGGREYAKETNEDQRRWARWLIHHGASLVVGAHPHVIQPTEHHAGAKVVHSLGNAIYPATLKGADSGRVEDFIISADRD